MNLFQEIFNLELYLVGNDLALSFLICMLIHERILEKITDNSLKHWCLLMQP